MATIYVYEERATLHCANKLCVELKKTFSIIIGRFILLVINTKRRATTTGSFSVRITNDELRALHSL